MTSSSKTSTIWWDTLDPQNPGWAYRHDGESGGLDGDRSATLADLLAQMPDAPPPERWTPVAHDGPGWEARPVPGDEEVPGLMGTKMQRHRYVEALASQRLSSCAQALVFAARCASTLDEQRAAMNALLRVGVDPFPLIPRWTGWGAWEVRTGGLVLADVPGGGKWVLLSALDGLGNRPVLREEYVPPGERVAFTTAGYFWLVDGALGVVRAR